MFIPYIFARMPLGRLKKKFIFSVEKKSQDGRPHGKASLKRTSYLIRCNNTACLYFWQFSHFIFYFTPFFFFFIKRKAKKKFCVCVELNFDCCSNRIWDEESLFSNCVVLLHAVRLYCWWWGDSVTFLRLLRCVYITTYRETALLLERARTYFVHVSFRKTFLVQGLILIKVLLLLFP